MSDLDLGSRGRKNSAQLTENNFELPQILNSPREQTQQRGQLGDKRYSMDINAKMKGIEQYEQHQVLLEIQRKQNTMENRIRRLAYQQERAHKLTDIANTKADKLLYAREMHQKKVEQKLRLQQERREQEERIRIKNQMERQQNQERINLVKHAVNRRNQDTRQYVTTTEKLGLKHRKMAYDEDLINKQRLKEKTKVSQQQFECYKHQNKYDHEGTLHHNYQVKETLRQRQLNDHADKIRQLEQIEGHMINELGVTQKHQQRAITNLHSVVQLCNQPIDITKLDILPSTPEHRSPNFESKQFHNNTSDVITVKESVESTKQIMRLNM